MTRPARIEHGGDVATEVVRPAWGERRLSAMRPIPRRGLSRIEAAMYVGVGATKFDEMVEDGRMPPPKKIDGRRIWDILALDRAFDLLLEEDSPATGSSWEGV